jgi:hypothetical protein
MPGYFLIAEVAARADARLRGLRGTAETRDVLERLCGHFDYKDVDTAKVMLWRAKHRFPEILPTVREVFDNDQGGYYLAWHFTFGGDNPFPPPPSR